MFVIFCGFLGVPCAYILFISCWRSVSLANGGIEISVIDTVVMLVTFTNYQTNHSDSRLF